MQILEIHGQYFFYYNWIVKDMVYIYNAITSYVSGVLFALNWEHCCLTILHLKKKYKKQMSKHE